MSRLFYLTLAIFGFQTAANATTWKPLIVCDLSTTKLDFANEDPARLQLVVADARAAQAIAEGINGTRAAQDPSLHAYDVNNVEVNSTERPDKVAKIVLNLDRMSLNPPHENFMTNQLFEDGVARTLTLEYFVFGSEPPRRSNWIFKNCVRS